MGPLGNPPAYGLDEGLYRLLLKGLYGPLRRLYRVIMGIYSK